MAPQFSHLRFDAETNGDRGLSAPRDSFRLGVLAEEFLSCYLSDFGPQPKTGCGPTKCSRDTAWFRFRMAQNFLRRD
jgi:hypothetical protein